MVKQVPINESSVLKILGLIFAVIIQSIGVYNALVNKFDEHVSESRAEIKYLTNELTKLKTEIVEREKFLGVTDVRKEFNDIHNKDADLIKKINELSIRISALEYKYSKK